MEYQMQMIGWGNKEPSETIPGDTTSIDQMVSDQPRLTPQFTGAITHTRFWVANVFVYH